MIGGERLICLVSNTSSKEKSLVIWSEFNEIVMFWQKWKIPGGTEKPLGFSVSCSLVRNKFQVLRSKCSRVLPTPPCRSYPGTFATFSPAHSGGNGASWPGLHALLSTLWKSSRNSRQKHIWTHTTDIHLSSATSGSDQISLAGITATDAEATTDEHKLNVILITKKRFKEVLLQFCSK